MLHCFTVHGVVWCRIYNDDVSRGKLTTALVSDVECEELERTQTGGGVGCRRVESRKDQYTQQLRTYVQYMMLHTQLNRAVFSVGEPPPSATTTTRQQQQQPQSQASHSLSARMYPPPTARDICHRSHLRISPSSPDCSSFACEYSYGCGHQVEFAGSVLHGG